MLAVVFVFNDPVNPALARWTPDTLSCEIDPALAAGLSTAALVGAWRREEVA